MSTVAHITTVPEAPTKLSMDERSAVLDGAVVNAAREGWQTTSRTPVQAQLIKGKPTNHVLHLILTLLTLGTWAIVWIAMALIGGQKQRFLTVDEFGIVHG